MNGNAGSQLNYEPNSFSGPVEDNSKKWHSQPVTGKIGRYKHSHPNTDYEQPGVLFRKVLNETGRNHLIENIVGDLGKCRKDIKERMVKLFYKVDAEYGERVAKGVGVSIEIAKL